MLFRRNRKKILIIDDDASLRQQLYFRLKHIDKFDVIETDTGEKGLVMAKRHKPDFIILDWILPHIQGDQVLALLRHEQNTRNTPILMLTVKNIFGEIENAFTLGASAYLTKPFSLYRLSKEIKRLCK